MKQSNLLQHRLVVARAARSSFAWGRVGLKRVAGLVVCTVLAINAASAFGNSVDITAKLTGVGVPAGTYDTVNIKLLDATLIDNSSHTLFSGNAIAGVERWTYVSGTPVYEGNNFLTYCIEITQDVQLTNPPTSYGFTFGALKNAPQPGSGVNPDGSGTGMGSVKAGYLQELWGRDYNTSLTSAANSAAFQLAVWKIVYGDTMTGGALDFSLQHGQLTALDATNSHAGDYGIVSQAQTWLNALTGAPNAPHWDLLALTSSTYQDQITVLPLPASAWMGVLLVGGLFAKRKLRSRTVEA